MGLFDKCGQFTRAREVMAAGIYPYFHPIQESEASEVVIDGRRLVMVGSNNYLGLTQHPAVREAAIRAVEKYGSGCTGSRFLNGTLDLHVELEERLARFMEAQAEISATRLERKIGRETTVLVDELTEDGTAIARSPADAPEIDGVVIIEDGAELQVGEFATVRITDAGEHDLWGEVVGG